MSLGRTEKGRSVMGVSVTGDLTNILVNADGSIAIGAAAGSSPDLEAVKEATEAQLANTRVTHESPSDFTVAFLSSTTLTFTSFPTELVTGGQVVRITQFKADHTYANFINGSNCKIDFAAGILTIHGSGTPFVTGDMYRVGLALQNKAYDASQNTHIVREVSPEKDWNTDYIPLVVEQDLTTSEAAFGSSIDVRTVKTLTVEITADVNTSEDCTLYIYSQQESGGTESTPQNMSLPSSAVLWSGVGTDFVHTYYFDVEGDTFVQLKAKVDTLGTAGDLTMSIRKSF